MVNLFLFMNTLTPLYKRRKRSEELDRSPVKLAFEPLSLSPIHKVEGGIVWSNLHLLAFSLHYKLVRECNLGNMLYVNKEMQTKMRKKKILFTNFPVYCVLAFLGLISFSQTVSPQCRNHLFTGCNGRLLFLSSQQL